MTYLSLLALIGTDDYGLTGSMCHIKEESTWIVGMKIIDGMVNVEKMVE
jgi:hypothetical protein